MDFSLEIFNKLILFTCDLELQNYFSSSNMYATIYSRQFSGEPFFFLLATCMKMRVTAY